MTYAQFGFVRIAEVSDPVHQEHPLLGGSSVGLHLFREARQRTVRESAVIRSLPAQYRRQWPDHLGIRSTADVLDCGTYHSHQGPVVALSDYHPDRQWELKFDPFDGENPAGAHLLSWHYGKATTEALDLGAGYGWGSNPATVAFALLINTWFAHRPPHYLHCYTGNYRWPERSGSIRWWSAGSREVNNHRGLRPVDAGWLAP